MRKEQCEMLSKDANQYLNDIGEVLNHYVKETEKESVIIPKVKSFLEHLRSILEYCAQDINDNVTQKKKGYVYFPYGKNESKFSKSIDRNLPLLKEQRKDIFEIIENLQDYKRSGENKFLLELCDMTNANKHSQLSEATRKDHKGISIGNYISVDDTSTVNVKDSTFDGVPSGNFSIEKGEVKGEINEVLKSKIVKWKDGKYIFKDNNKEIIDFLSQCYNEVNNFYQSLYKIL